MKKSVKTQIEPFIRSYRYNPNKEIAESLLKGNAAYSLPSQLDWQDYECLAENIKLSVTAYTRSKDNAICVYKDFVRFLKEKNIAEIDVRFPPIPISSSFERQMFIAKYLQDPSHSISELPDLLWVGSRTIDDDLRKLMGHDDDPIQICGRRFTIPDTRRRKGYLSFESTAHPLFLTPNISQVIAQLKGLKTLADDPLFKNYAETAAADIWEQLTDFAKARILLVLRELLNEDTAWYEELAKYGSEDGYDSFYTEQRCGYGQNVILDCLKNGKSFAMVYLGDDGKPSILKDCRIVGFSSDKFLVQVAGEQKEFDENRVLRSAYTLQELV